MEYKALILGLAFSLGIFALKNGLGLHYVLKTSQARVRSKVLGLCAYALLYAVLFALSFWGLEQVNLLNHFQTLQEVMRSGMLIHALLAGLLLVWGWILLSRTTTGSHRSLGWIALVMPCPVCALVIFFNVSLLLAFFPQAGMTSLVLVWAGFVGTGLVTALLLTLLFPVFKTSPESLLGGAMVSMAAFFLLSVMVMPQFSQLDEIYSLASYPGEKSQVSPAQAAGLAVIVLTAFAVGCAVHKHRSKGFRPWLSERS